MCIMNTLLGTAICQYLWTPGVPHKDAGTASTAATVALGQPPLGTLGGVMMGDCSITARKDAIICTQQKFQTQLYWM